MPSIKPTPPHAVDVHTLPRGSAFGVFLVFLKLGFTSFGGPVAHLGYFRAELVARRQWLNDGSFSDLVALCQFLPGPTSSQVGMALGLRRAGLPGALAAWTGFTLPSALLMILFGLGLHQWSALVASGALHGLKVVAVAVVAQALLAMSRALCPDRPRAILALVAALLAMALPSGWGQITAIVFGAVAGHRLLPGSALAPARHHDYGISKKVGAMLLLTLVLLLTLLPAWAAAAGTPMLQAFAVVFHAGALVFGGGHVVLPLLQVGVVPPGWVGNDVFLAGYGLAQALPGPLFSFAAFLGAVMAEPTGGWMGAAVMLVAIFLPGFLLLLGALPFWELLRQRPGVQSAVAGVNAAVVGILAAAFYDPIWTTAIHGRPDFGLALATFGLLVFSRLSPALVVALAACCGWLLPLIT